jgi:hypothetical protein
VVGATKFEARIKKLVENLPDLVVLVEPLLIVRRVLHEQVNILHRRLLAVVRNDDVCRRLKTIPGVGPVVALTYRVTSRRYRCDSATARAMYSSVLRAPHGRQTYRALKDRSPDRGIGLNCSSRGEVAVGLAQYLFWRRGRVEHGAWRSFHWEKLREGETPPAASPACVSATSQSRQLCYITHCLKLRAATYAVVQVKRSKSCVAGNFCAGLSLRVDFRPRSF